MGKIEPSIYIHKQYSGSDISKMKQFLSEYRGMLLSTISTSTIPLFRNLTETAQTAVNAYIYRDKNIVTLEKCRNTGRKACHSRFGGTFPGQAGRAFKESAVPLRDRCQRRHHILFDGKGHNATCCGSPGLFPYSLQKIGKSDQIPIFLRP